MHRGFLIRVELSEQSFMALAREAFDLLSASCVRAALAAFPESEVVPSSTQAWNERLEALFADPPDADAPPFPDKRAAAAEIARVLKPGARFALSDMVAESQRLPAELRTLEAWVSCFADARPLEEVAGLLADVGLEPELLERHDGALAGMLDRVEARLRAARLLGAGAPAALVQNVDRGLALAAAARESVSDGALGYGVVVARRA